MKTDSAAATVFKPSDAFLLKKKKLNLLWTCLDLQVSDGSSPVHDKEVVPSCSQLHMAGRGRDSE